MGIFINLYILPSQLRADAWARFFDEALDLLRAHPGGLLSHRVEETATGERSVLSRTLERAGTDSEGRHVNVCGDFQSRQYAESFLLYRDLDHYRREEQPLDDPDILLPLVDPAQRGIRSVFSDKTQGLPYHLPMLAVAMLAESHFPLAAHASGDIDRAQAARAQAWAGEVLGRRIPLPVCVDAERLWRRLRGPLTLPEAEEAFEHIHRGEALAGEEALLQRLDPDEARSWLRNSLKGYAEPSMLGVLRLFIAWLNAGLALEPLLEVSCLDPEGPGFPPAGVIEALAETCTTLPPDLIRPFKGVGGEGVPTSVDAQLAGVMLDRELMGRYIRRHLPEASVMSAIADLFPDDAETLKALMRDHAKDLRRRLEALGVPARGAAMPQEALLGQRHGWLFTAPSLQALSEAQLHTARWFTFAILRLRDHLPGDPDLASSYEAGVAEKRRAILHLLQKSVTLTEDAWAAIEGEEDDHHLGFLLALSAVEDDRYAFAEMRRAMLENSPLRGELLSLFKDPEVYDAVLREVEAHRAQSDAAGAKGMG